MSPPTRVALFCIGLLLPSFAAAEEPVRWERDSAEIIVTRSIRNQAEVEQVCAKAMRDIVGEYPEARNIRRLGTW